MGYRAYWDTVKAKKHEGKENEDNLMFSEYTFMGDVTVKLMVVADGMGGLSNGATASYNAVIGFMEAFYSKTMKSYLESKMDGFSLEYTIDIVEKIMRESVFAANRKVCRGAQYREETGSTISAVCVVEDYAVAVNVGDSPIYHFSSRKKHLKKLSELQTLAEMNVKTGKYERNSIGYYKDDHRLYNYLGQYDEMDPMSIHVQKIGQMENGDIILIGSDGAYGRISNELLTDELNDSYEGGEEAESYFLESLFQMARIDKDDDQSAILYVVQK